MPDQGLPPPIVIRDEPALQRLARQLATQHAIAVDVEANPLFAYRERLCLLQISTRRRDYIVDPLGTLDLGSIAPVLADSGVLKIVHGAEYDILLLKRSFPFEIRGLFDTKVAAMSLGHESPGLAAVVRDRLGVKLDKKFQRSDWGKRPLSDGQLDYARRDTHYLLELASILRAELHDAPWPHMEEVAAECRRVEALVPDPQRFDPTEYVRIKGASKLDPVGRRVLKDLNALRHEIASERDKPLFKVLSNEMLLRLASARPETIGELRRTRILSAKLADRYGDETARVIRRAVSRGPLRRERVPERSPEDALALDQRAIYDELRRWRRATADRRKTEASLVLARSVMIELARSRPTPRTIDEIAATGLLEGWRVECYGHELMRALQRFAAEPRR